MWFRSSRSSLLLVISVVAGCASDLPPLPTYPLESSSDILSTIHARAQSLDKVTGKGSLTLNSPARGSVRLDTAFVLQQPERARIRAWKFNQAVFDLTVTPEGTWLYSPRADAMPDSNKANAGITEWLRYLQEGVPSGVGDVRDEKSDTLIITSAREANGSQLTTTIDRPTRTVRSYRLVDSAGTERFTLTLDRYRAFGPALWPTRIIARSQTGTITLETSDLQPGIVAPTAFTPSVRAKRLP